MTNGNSADIELVLRDAMTTYANSIDTPDYAVRVALALSVCADGGKGEAVTLTGAQLLEAFNFVAPDYPNDADQLECEVTIQRGEGHDGIGTYCWITDYPDEGSMLLDGTTAESITAQQADGGKGEAVAEPAYSWMPIKTAPRDGTNILIRFGQDGVSQAKYVPGTPHPWKFIDTNDGITWLINRAKDDGYGPSHWMRMPHATCAEPGNHTAPQAECAPRKYVEMQPGSPNFDGAEAYEAYLNAECAPREAQLDGWKLVPVEPTREMIDAAGESIYGHSRAKAKEWVKEEKFEGAANVGVEAYRVMLEAAPTPERAQGFTAIELDWMAKTRKENFSPERAQESEG